MSTPGLLCGLQRLLGDLDTPGGAAAAMERLVGSGLDKLPQCRDANDQMSIELAALGKADYLVTGDKDLPVMSAQLGGRIVTEKVFLQAIGAG